MGASFMSAPGFHIPPPPPPVLPLVPPLGGGFGVLTAGAELLFALKVTGLPQFSLAEADLCWSKHFFVLALGDSKAEADL